MKHILARSVVAGLAMVCVGSTSAWALDPGNYTVQCAAGDGPRDNAATYDIRMDMVDLLTLRTSLGTIISGVKLDDGKRVILTGDRGCALVQTERSRNGNRTR